MSGTEGVPARTPNLVWFGDGSLNDLHVFLAEEAVGQQVVQEALDAPERGHQQLSVACEEVKARHSGFLYLTHCLRSVTLCGTATDQTLASSITKLSLYQKKRIKS